MLGAENHIVITEAYEVLRIEPHHGGGERGGALGRAVVVHRGVVAWLAAWSCLRTAAPTAALKTAPPADSAAGSPGSVPATSCGPSHRAAARILTGMVLDNLGEIHQ